MRNPLLSEWTTEFELAPFATITDAHFAPAFEAAMAEAKLNIEKIADNPAAASFANTIEALELADKSLIPTRPIIDRWLPSFALRLI